MPGLASLALAGGAGVLSTLSPCVLPLLPLVFASAVAAHRFGMVALGAGLIVSFVAVGLFVATVGFSIGLDGGLFRFAAAAALGCVGVVLLSTRLQERVSGLMGRATGGFGAFVQRMPARGLGGQFLLGVALGTVWSPCVGPTLGAAALLAAQGKDLPAVAATMAVFGAGAAIPLVLVGLLSREALRRWRGTMLSGASGGKQVLGGVAVAASVLILTGLDHRMEAALVAWSPDWLTDLTTRL